MLDSFFERAGSAELSSPAAAEAANDQPWPSWQPVSYGDEQANADPQRLRAALEMGSLGFSFSGGGFLLPFYVGAIRALAHLGLLRPGVTHVGGSSAGALAAAIVSCGLDIDTVLHAVRELISECREHGVYKRLGPAVRRQLEAVLPEDAHERCSCTTHIAISKVKAYGVLHPKRVSHFATRSDLIDALAASTYIPLLSDGKLTTRFRGRRVVDGSVTDLMPVPSQPHHVVKITCLPLANVERMIMRNKAVALQHISVSLSKHREWPYSRMETLGVIFRPGPDDFVDFLLEAGTQDIMTWATAAGLLVDTPMPALKLSLATTGAASSSEGGSSSSGGSSSRVESESSGNGTENGGTNSGRAKVLVPPPLPQQQQEQQQKRMCRRSARSVDAAAERVSGSLISCF